MVILPGAGGELLTEDGSRDIFEDVKQLKETVQLDFSKDIYLYSQTTKSLDEFHRIIERCV